jgi:hypothetical protein
MKDDQEIETNIKRELKWKELAIRIEHYKYYLNITLQVNAFFYLITGGVLGFYLKNPTESAKHPLEYVLLLPILLGAVLGGIFIYGARLQEKAIYSMEHVREEMHRLGLDIEDLHDAHLLNIMLRIFGYIFYSVVAALILVPFRIGSAPSLELRPFAIIASAILIGGGLLPLIARWFDNRLKERRKKNLLKIIDAWLSNIPAGTLDVLSLKDNYFYYDWLPHLSKKTIESIKDGTFTKDFLVQDIDKYKRKLEREKPQEKTKTWWEWLTGA